MIILRKKRYFTHNNVLHGIVGFYSICSAELKILKL